jgi:protein ImuB
MIRPPELYACIYVRELAAQALLRLRPELQDKPCVVLEGEPPLESVCALNTRARLLGLRHGMTQVEVETFENVMVLQRSRHALLRFCWSLGTGLLRLNRSLKP